jgi:hypothetical protein
MATMTCLKYKYGTLLSILIRATKSGKFDQMRSVPSEYTVAKTSPQLPTLCSGKVVLYLLKYHTERHSQVVEMAASCSGDPGSNSGLQTVYLYSVVVFFVPSREILG